MNKSNLITVLFFIIFIGLTCCKAQNLPLLTSEANIPNNGHVKDTNNELLQYTGTYKAYYQGNEITLFITKEDDKPINYFNKMFYRDALNIKYIINNSTGLTLEDTENIVSDIQFYSTKIYPSANNRVVFYFSGKNCRVGSGEVLLKKLTNTQITWEYIPNAILIDDDKCPPGTDITIHLPETENLIFTKQ